MKVECINAFIGGVVEVFATMLEIEVTRGDVGVTRSGSSNSQDIMALIGLSGTARGMVALSFPTATALALVRKLLGMEIAVVDNTVADGVAEIVDMVAGSAKTKLTSDGGPPIDLSLPTVVRGKSFEVEYPTKAIWIEVVFQSSLGDFSLCVTFEEVRP
jgi:chemotaxis protein CheX